MIVLSTRVKDMFLVPRILLILQGMRNSYATHNDNEENGYVHSISKE